MTNLEIAQTTKDQDRLWSLRKSRDISIRCTVAERIEDQDRLWEMRKDSYRYVRYEVAIRIENCSYLREMRASENNDAVIEAIDTRLCEMAGNTKEDII